jgi:hypothetical protein
VEKSWVVGFAICDRVCGWFCVFHGKREARKWKHEEMEIGFWSISDKMGERKLENWDELLDYFWALC